MIGEAEKRASEANQEDQKFVYNENVSLFSPFRRPVYLGDFYNRGNREKSLKIQKAIEWCIENRHSRNIDWPRPTSQVQTQSLGGEPPNLADRIPTLISAELQTSEGEIERKYGYQK